MKNIIFFDTETTGNTEKDFLCQIAYKDGEESFAGLYKPPLRIPPEASAVHHISNRMVEEKPAFKDSPEYEKIKELFENENSVLIAHNAPFDLLMVKKEGIEPKNFICTLRLARHLDPDEKIEKYNLQYLRYFLDIEIDATAHDALGDVLVLEKLYERLKKKLSENLEVGLPSDSVIEKMIEISSHPSIFKSIKFGKYNGSKIEEILQTDRGYLEWLLDQKIQNAELDEDWVYTLRYYLGK